MKFPKDYPQRTKNLKNQGNFHEHVSLSNFFHCASITDINIFSMKGGGILILCSLANKLNPPFKTTFSGTNFRVITLFSAN